jgi:hypothetical protein
MAAIHLGENRFAASGAGAACGVAAARANASPHRGQVAGKGGPGNTELQNVQVGVTLIAPIVRAESRKVHS